MIGKGTKGSFKKGHAGYWLGKKKPPLSKETREKISKTLLGHSVSEETRRKIGQKSKGRVAWNKDRPWSEEVKVRISKTNKRRGIEPKFKNKFPCGEKHPNWNGGTSFEPYSVDWTETLRRSIRERDNYICRVCYQYGYPVHHIDYNKKNNNPDNLVTLCQSCHSKTNYDRDYWILFFTGGLN